MSSCASPSVPDSVTTRAAVTADTGDWGFGTTIFGPPTISLINDHLGPLVAGENPLATDRLWDMMMRISSPYSAAGLGSYAISGIDLALWDLKGRALKLPVYELAGGPAHDAQPVYATGNDTDWHLELGFRTTKLACPYGTFDGLEALSRNEELVAKTRELVGRDVELMLDCWMAFDVEFAVRLAERLRPYGLKWIEDCLIPEDFAAHQALRARLPWMTLTGGEHWYTPYAFFNGAKEQVFDIFRRITPLVEPLSLDEAYLDVTENAWGEPLAVRVARRIKAQIRETTGLTASAGVAPNKFLAKVASGWKKPDGLTVIAPERVEAFVRDLPVDALWGVGPKTAARLREHGLHTLADVRDRPLDELQAREHLSRVPHEHLE